MGTRCSTPARRIRPDSSNAGSIIDEIAGLPLREHLCELQGPQRAIGKQPELLNINPAGAGHLASVNVAADGQTLFIYRSDDGGDGNIYESKLVGEVWSDPVLMGSDINTKSWEPMVR
jgi:hypothetical protein